MVPDKEQSPRASMETLRQSRSIIYAAVRLKVKLVNVFLVKNERLAEQDIVALNFELPKCSRSKGFVGQFQSPIRERLRSIKSKIAQVFCLPKNHAVGHAFFDVPTIFARQPETDHFHLVALAGLFHRLRRTRDSW